MASTMKNESKKSPLKKTMKKNSDKKKEEKMDRGQSVELVKEAKDGTTKGEADKGLWVDE